MAALLRKSLKLLIPLTEGLSSQESLCTCSTAAPRLLQCLASAPPQQRPFYSSSSGRSNSAKKWNVLVNQGHQLNPCGSQFHPAQQAGVLGDVDVPEISLQEAYTPASTCYGCGPSADEHALHLRSFRAKDGLEARISIPPNFCCFPGMVTGGVLTTLLECHGNWTAAIELMDTSCLPKPPLTVTYSMLVTFRQPTPPDTPLVIRSKVTSVKSGSSIGVGKTTVEVDLALYEQVSDGNDRLLVTGAGIFKRMGALRAL